MDYIHPYIQNIQSKLVNSILKNVKLKVDEFIIDATSFASHGIDSIDVDHKDQNNDDDKDINLQNVDYQKNGTKENDDQSENQGLVKEQVRRLKGYSRAKRPDLAQINFMLGVNGEYIPLYFETFAGNTSDIKMFSYTLKNLKENYPSLLKAYKKKYFVFDRGNWNKENSEVLINLCKTHHFYFVAGIRNDLVIKEILQWNPTKARKIHNDGKNAIKGFVFEKNIYKEKNKILLYYSPLTARKQLNKLNEKISRVQKDFQSLIDGTNRSNDEIYAQTKALIKKHRASRLFKIVKQKIDGKETIDCQIKQENLQKYKTKAGRFALMTNNLELSGKKIYQIYLTEQTVEQSFHIAKHLLSASRIFHSNSRRIETHLAIVSWGFLFLSILKQLLSKQYIPVTFETLMKQLHMGKLSKTIYHYPEYKTFEISKLINVTEEVKSYLKLFKLPHDYFHIRDVPTFSQEN
jgi:transposase